MGHSLHIRGRGGEGGLYSSFVYGLSLLIEPRKRYAKKQPQPNMVRFVTPNQHGTANISVAQKIAKMHPDYLQLN
jgi:hypothetical protein